MNRELISVYYVNRDYNKETVCVLDYDDFKALCNYLNTLDLVSGDIDIDCCWDDRHSKFPILEEEMHYAEQFIKNVLGVNYFPNKGVCDGS
tara:strand:- start:7155 stop:7427 length:273 start_codon:yes stop_codon:yes gene_type:complete